MVQKQGKRGRPREYDPQIALRRATDAFWDGGFAGTSLDDLSARMGMNRPSLYAAFGDKEALFLKTLEGYIAARRAFVQAAFRSGDPLSAALRKMYRGMIDLFLGGDRGPRGCYLVGTAVTEALGNPRVRKLLAEAQQELEQMFRAAFSAAKARGELGARADPRALAAVASAIVNALGMHARGGETRARLRAVAGAAAELICPSGR